MRLSIMQPYFMPYIGYFQLIAAADHFIVYDNIKYTKSGWINRNRMLVSGKDALFTLPLKSGSDFLNINEREILIDFNVTKFLNKFRGAYSKAPYFNVVYPVLEGIVNFKDRNLFNFVFNSISCICNYLNIKTNIICSSNIQIDHNLKSQDKVLALCKAMNASVYINAIGGQGLYSNLEFASQGIDLKFIKSRLIKYGQFEDEFVPWLSIIDVLMFNSSNAINDILQAYDLI